MTNQQLAQRLHSAINHRLENYQHRLKATSLALHTLSPLQTLSRGYAIIKDQQQHIVRSSAEVKVGDRITAQLGQGQLQCAVEAVEENSDVL